MEIRRVDPEDDATVRALVELGEAVSAADSPWAVPAGPLQLRGMLRHGWDGEVPEWWVAVTDEGVVGDASLWASDYDNLTSAWFGLGVHPTVRRRGVGTALLNHLADRALERGRPLVGIGGWEASASSAWASRHGFEQRAADVQRRLELRDVPGDLVAQVDRAQQEHAGAYELLTVEGVLPEELLDSASRMWAAINDAPTDDLEIEEEAFPVERIRGYEAAQRASGLRLHRVIARHRETGELAGHSVVAVRVDRPDVGDQHDTSVVRAHRGHRLGLILKTRLLQHLAEAEPQLALIDTWNAASNGPMIAVNERMGYRVLGRSLGWQQRLVELPSTVAG